MTAVELIRIAPVTPHEVAFGMVAMYATGLLVSA